MIRVLEVITPSRIGGAEVYVADLCEGLSALGASVSLFCPSGRPFIDYAAARGIASTNWKTHGKLDPATVIKLARLIKTTRADVIHTHLSTASLLGAFAAKLAGVPSVAHVHGLNSATCFRHSTAIIAVSEAAKRHLIAQGIPESKVRVVHNGVDMARFTPMPISTARAEIDVEFDRARYPIAPAAESPVISESRLIGVFGRLSPEKGQRTALEAMAVLVQSIPNARLLIVGDGKDRDELISLAASLGISEHTRFEAFSPDIRALMSACDIVLVPSVKEGFGLVAVNAMALERAVIATAGGLPEIVRDNETGLLVPQKDPNAMAQALAELLPNQARMSTMGKQGRKVAEESFDLTRQIGRVLEVLKESTSR